MLLVKSDMERHELILDGWHNEADDSRCLDKAWSTHESFPVLAEASVYSGRRRSSGKSYFQEELNSILCMSIPGCAKVMLKVRDWHKKITCTKCVECDC